MTTKMTPAPWSKTYRPGDKKCLTCETYPEDQGLPSARTPPVNNRSPLKSRRPRNRRTERFGDVLDALERVRAFITIQGGYDQAVATMTTWRVSRDYAGVPRL